MPAMLNLITLYREALHEPDPELSMPHDAPELAMDYFDTLIARSFSNVKRDSIREFLGLNIDEEFDQNRVAMQSIPLYCPALVYDTFHKEHPREYQDPFLIKEYSDDTQGQDHEIQMPYLSLIEVFITPEIMARLDMEAVCQKHSGDCFDREDREALRIYNAFYRDLHMLMEGFLKDAKENLGPDEKFIYCIYESLSIGDFALVIRSTRPETAFKLTTLLRERSCRLEYSAPELKKENDPKELVFYKTFTVFSLSESLAGMPFSSDAGRSAETDRKARINEETAEASVISEDDEPLKEHRDTDDPCRYVLRGVLTNRYWSNFRKDKEEGAKKSAASGSFGIRDILNDAALIHDIRRLHGRYDFTVTLSEQAFRAIHPILLRYKLDRNIELPMAGSRPDVKKMLNGHHLKRTEEMICETLILYIWKGYVSYVNERYLFSLDTSYIKVKSCNDDICLKPVEGELRFTNDYIEKEIRTLRKRIRNTGGNLQFLTTSRNSLIYSMKLLEKLASICSSVNGISDARIYSLVICRQIEAMLNGFDEYFTHIVINDDFSVIGHLDQDLKTAIESINSFAQFILKSTIQSFQVPIYNLESHVSVEKMLTGYSWLLQSILKWYDNSEFSRQIRGRTQKYLTVMAPDRFDGDLSTKSIFFKLNERSDRLREKLLTVYCPSFSSLTDFTSAFGTFYHEIAHYIRYESRYDRNLMILEYSSWLLFDQTADQIISDFILNTAELTDVADIRYKMIQCFAESYQEAIYPVFAGTFDTGQMNLMLLIQEIKKIYNRVIDRVHSLSDLETSLEAFLNNSAYIVDSDADKIMACLKELQNAIVGENECNYEPYELYMLVEKARELLDDYIKLREVKRPDVSPGSAESWYLAGVLWNVSIKIGVEEAGRFIAERNAIQKFFSFFYEKLMNCLDSSREDNRSRRFYIYLFPERNRLYKEEGIKRLRRYVTTYIINAKGANLELMDRYLGMYREVASDLFMVKGLGLSPFGYFNFFIRNIPMENNIPVTYMERFCRVLYSLKGEEVEAKETKTTWQDVFYDIFKGLCSFLVQISKNSVRVLSGTVENRAFEIDNPGVKLLQKEFAELMKKLEYQQNSGNMLQKQDMEDFCYQIYNDYLIQIWEHFDLLHGNREPGRPEAGMSELREILEDIRHAFFLCQSFILISDQFHSKSITFDSYPFLKKDLFAGNRNLDRMSEEMKKSSLVKNYCSKVALEFNEPEAGGMDADAESSVQNHLWKVDFILDMHYGMIWEYAAKIIESKAEESAAQ